MRRSKTFKTSIIFIVFAFVNIYSDETNHNTFNSYESNYTKHMIDIGSGIGLDYGGLLGVKVAYIFPFPNISIFGSIGYQLIGLGWNTGFKYNFFPENSKYVFRPNVKIMYGTNTAVLVAGKEKYNKIFQGFTPGLGLEFMFGQEKSNGFDFDLNFPIRGNDFSRHMDSIRQDPEIIKLNDALPIAISIGYHHEF